MKVRTQTDKMQVTSCSRMLGWKLCGNKHRCDDQPVFFAVINNMPRYFCEVCGVQAQRQGHLLFRIV